MREVGADLSNDIVAVKDWLVANFPFVQRIWLYGSRARGDQTPRADIDLAVECAPETSRDEWMHLANSVAESAPTFLFVDIICLDTVQDALKTNIRREGRVIYERTRGDIAD